MAFQDTLNKLNLIKNTSNNINSYNTNTNYNTSSNNLNYSNLTGTYNNNVPVTPKYSSNVLNNIYQNRQYQNNNVLNNIRASKNNAFDKINNRLSSMKNNVQDKFQNLVKEGNLNNAVNSTANFNFKLATGNVNVNKNKVAMVQQGLKSQGVKYTWGGNDLTKGVDCSGLTSQLYAGQGIKIPRTAQEQYNKSTKVNVNDMQVGDLIFFDTLKGNNKKVDHVGVYIGDGKMLHASSGKKQVVTTDLNTKYWNSVLVGAGRY